jgi:hypothetical protein
MRVYARCNPVHYNKPHTLGFIQLSSLREPVLGDHCLLTGYSGNFQSSRLTEAKDIIKIAGGTGWFIFKLCCSVGSDYLILIIFIVSLAQV